MLTDVCGDDGFALGEGVQFINDLLHAQAALLLIREGEFLLVAVQRGQPVFRRQFFDQRKEIAQRGLGIAFDGDIDLDHLVELRRINVDVDELGVAAKHVRLADDAVIETGADIEDEVGFADGLVRIGGAVHAQHAEGQRVRLREDTLAQQGRGDRAAEGFSQHQQFLIGTGDHGTLTGEDHGALGTCEQTGGFFNANLINLEVFFGMVAGQIHRLVKGAGEGALAEVLGNVDQNRTRATRGGDVVGLLGDAGQGIGALDQVVVLHDRGRDVEDVGFLEGVLAQHPTHRLTAKDDHRDAVHLRRHETGDGVAGARAGSDENDGGLASGTGVAVSHVNGTLLMADENELHVRLHRLERIKDRDGCSAGIPEDVLDAEICEGFDERLRAVHFLLAHDDWGENCDLEGENGSGIGNRNLKMGVFGVKIAIPLVS